MHIETQSDMDIRHQPRTEPCTWACTQASTEKGAETSTVSSMVLPAREGHCPRGFSRLQVAILGVLKTHQQIIAYWQIAALVSSAYGLTATEGAVRGALERLYRRGGFLMRSRAGSGGLKGNRYAFTAEPCPGIRPCAEAQPTML